MRILKACVAVFTTPAIVIWYSIVVSYRLPKECFDKNLWPWQLLEVAREEKDFVIWGVR